ncbi:zinc dependent phospholipase C family protein [Desulfoplanes sp.]
MRQTVRIIFLGIFFLLISAPTAFAWGAGVHMAIGNHILNHLGMIAPAIAAVLAKHPRSFLYGCLSADIFIGKGCRTTPTHSHNWSVGKRLLDLAPSSRLKAYAYGYLSHLAADTVAHNFYVPNMLAQTPGSGKLNHVYIEMQADMYVAWNPSEARELFKHKHRGADRTLLEVTENKRFPFYLKKQLFRGSVLASGQKSWNTSLGLMDQVIPRATDPAYLDQMVLLSRNVVRDFLSTPKTSVVLDLDPVGTRNLRHAHLARKGRRKAIRQGKSLPVFPVPLKLRDLVPGSPSGKTWLRAANDS